MAIIDLQRRMRQLGEIRIGHAVDTGRVSDRTGQPIRRPEKLTAFRVTSASSALLEPVARLYGGTVQQYTPANNAPDEWEVYTQTDRLPVIVPPENAVTQWYEQYKGGLCIRRCDGRTEQKQDRPCLCDAEQRDCQITTRLNVMLRDVPGMGVWLLTSRGYYAAVELPDVAEFLAMTRGYVNGWLTMEEKVIPRASGPASRFMVPKLDVDVSPGQLMAGQGGAATAVAAGQAPAVGQSDAPAIEAPSRDWAAELEHTHSTDAVRALWREASQAGAMTPELDAAMQSRAADVKAAEKARAAESAPAEAYTDAGNHEDERSTAEAVWMQIISSAGEGWTTSSLVEAFASRYGGLTPGSAEAGQLRAFLADLQAGEVTRADTAPEADAEEGTPF